MLKPQHLLFVANYVADVQNDPKGKNAAVIAGYEPSYGVTLLAKPDIQAAVNKRMLQLLAPLGVNSRDIIQWWLDIATADPLASAYVRRTCCRYCWGLNHAYQWDEDEYRQAVNYARLKGNPEPSDEGGLDWEHNQSPNAECPKCCGEGVADVYIEDMRLLSERDRKLIASVERTKYGVKVNYHSQPDAIDNLAKVLGMAVASKLELTGPNGGPIQTQNANVNVDLKDLSPQEASKVYQALVSGKS